MDNAKVLDDQEPEQVLAAKIADLGREFLKGGYYLRLVMTDDILSIKDVHIRAKEGKDEFFYGVTIPDRLQAVVDSFVRDDKKLFLKLIEQGEERLAELGLEASFDKVQQGYLVKLTGCGMGFFISKTIHTQRHLRQTRMTMGKLDKVLNSGERTTGRRKLVLGTGVVI